MTPPCQFITKSSAVSPSAMKCNPIFEKLMKEDKDAKRLERSSAVLKKFGLIPRTFDLQAFLVAMLREQVAGYYDPKTKTVNSAQLG